MPRVRARLFLRVVLRSSLNFGGMHVRACVSTCWVRACVRVDVLGLVQSKRWVYIANAWEEHRLAIMGETPHWYLWTIAVLPESSAGGAIANATHARDDDDDDDADAC